MAFTYDAGNIQLGACKIWADVGAGYSPIGLTIDAQVVGYEPTYQEIMANETGDALVDKILRGEKMTVSFTMLEHTNENFEKLVPFATEYTGSGTSYGFGTTPYGSLLDKVFKMKLHPINQSGSGGVDDEAVLTYDWTFWKCANSSPVSIEYNKDGTRNFKVVLDVFVDSTKTAGYQLAIRGDPANTTLDVTPPTVSVKVEKSDVLTAVNAGTELADVDATTTIQLTFSEELESGSALNYKHYGLYNETTDVGVDLSGATITYTASTKIVLITPASSLSAGVHYVLSIQGVTDTSLNKIVPASRRFAVAA